MKALNLATALLLSTTIFAQAEEAGPCDHLKDQKFAECLAAEVEFAKEWFENNREPLGDSSMKGDLELDFGDGTDSSSKGVGFKRLDRETLDRLLRGKKNRFKRIRRLCRSGQLSSEICRGNM